MSMTHTKIAAALFATSLATGPAIAGEFQDLEALDVAVAASMGAEIGQPNGARAPVDRRLKLKPCPEQPVVSGPVLGAAVIRCETIGWSIRVPLTAATPNATRSAAPARHAAAAPADRDAVIRGQAVRLTVEGSNFALSQTMTADRSGRVGEMIPVRLDRRSKPVMARIIGVGEVSLAAD